MTSSLSPSPFAPQEELPEGPTESEEVVLAGPHCIAQFDFAAANPGELGLSAGDCVELLQKVDEEWLRGRKEGVEGIFPAGFVKIVVDLPKDDISSRNPKVVIAQFDFEGLEGELSFKVYLTYKNIFCRYNGR